MGTDVSVPASSIVNPLKDTGKMFVMKIYGLEEGEQLNHPISIIPWTMCYNNGILSVQMYKI